MPNNSRRPKKEAARPKKFPRVERPPSMVNQVERMLREAIKEGRFAGGKLPTEMELAEQLGVSRETVRLAEDALQREGLLVKIRRRGTFTQPPRLPVRLGEASLQEAASTEKLLGYLQTDFVAADGAEELANRTLGGLLLQGVLAGAAKAGYQVVVHRTSHVQWRKAAQQITADRRLRGLICASYDEEKMLRNFAAAGLPTVLVDQDTNVPRIHSVRDDSFEGARDAIRYLTKLGHTKIAYAHWSRAEMNPIRPLGYRKGLLDAGLARRRTWEILTELTEAGAAAMIDTLLALKPRPTALYCFNNTLARLAIRELTRRDVQVPEEMSVVGAGGEDLPGVTCHQVDWYEMGREGVRILLRAIERGNAAKDEHRLFPHKLRVGITTAPPAMRPATRKVPKKRTSGKLRSGDFLP